MAQIPIWLGAIATLFMIASVLGAAVAVYRTSVYSTSLKESDASVTRLRAEIGDYQRREVELEGQIALVKQGAEACQDRCAVMEDLLTHRQDDDVIRAEIAAVRHVVDEMVLPQIATILRAVERNEGPDA